jgi:hypothetical protein
MAKETANTPEAPQVKGLQDTKLVRLEWEGTHADLENRNIVILTAVPVRTQYGDAFVCDVQIDDKKAPILMGGSVVVDQINTILDDLPVLCRIEKQNRYYLLVEAKE